MSIKQIVKNYFEDNQINVFHIRDIKRDFSGYAPKYLDIVLREIINLEYSAIEKGKYCRNTFRDEYVIGNILTKDATVAYWSALNIYGLTEQFPNKVYIQTTKKKPNKEVFGVQYRFIKVKPAKMFGIVNRGIGSNQFRITDVEKTIIDCFDLPQYSGGFMELIRAFKRTKLSSRKMIKYLELLNKKAVTKRIGYLSELFDKQGFKQLINYAKKTTSKNYDLIDIFGENKGKYNSKWRLILNIEEENLLEIANSIY